MTPYVTLQEQIVSVLFNLQGRKPAVLKQIIELYCAAVPREFRTNDLLYLEGLGFCFSEAGYLDIADLIVDVPRILREQIDTSTQDPRIRGILGTAFQSREPVGFREYINSRGSGSNTLRTGRLAQPRALIKGDVLGNGDRLLSEPREGGTGSVLIHLTGGRHGHWIEVPARIPIALLTPDDEAPADLVES